MNNSLIPLINQAVAFLNQNNLENADSILSRIIQIEPKNFEAQYLSGVVNGLQNKHLEASEFFLKSLKIKPKHAEANFNYAKSLSELGKHKESIKYHQICIQLAPKNPDAWLNYGKSLSLLERYKEALSCFENLISLNKFSLEGNFNKGILLTKLNRYKESLLAFDSAIKINPTLDYIWLNKGTSLDFLDEYDEAIHCYQTALSLNKTNDDSWSALGQTLQKIKNYTQALQCFKSAIDINPSSSFYWFSAGHLNLLLKKIDESIICFDKALSFKYDNVLALFYKGLCYQELNEPLKAIKEFSTALSFNPNENFVVSNILFNKLRSGDWRDLGQFINSYIHSNSQIDDAFTSLYVLDDPQLQLIKASKYASHFRIHSQNHFKPVSNFKKKIRVGYFSADFKWHAVSILTAELYELHDRDCFEIFAFSFGEAAHDDLYRPRLKQAFDHFFDLEGKSDKEISQLILSLDIDIAIDLGGYTLSSPTRLFFYRIAPIQINYLGYPGTLGSKVHDYIIADEHLVPSKYQECYSEKIIYMPDCFQVNDSQRQIACSGINRESYDFDSNVFIFCCFNNSYKIIPELFRAWASILNAVPNSVLWLNYESEDFKNNIYLEASLLNIDPTKIHFAKRLVAEKYLERLQLADLFLDTLPFNAGTTASDALWAGLPVLTCSGKSFAGRMATSLLNAIELPELITNSMEEYISKAIFLANNPDKLTEIRTKLQANRLTSPLFNTPLFVSNIEKAYKEIYQRYLRGEPPAHILVKNLL